MGGRGRWRNLLLVRNAHRLRAGRPNWDCMDAAGIANFGLRQRLNYAMNFGRHWHGCLCREAMDGLQDLPMRLGEQFGSAYCKTGMFCGRADELRISTMSARTATPEPPTRLVKRCGRWAQRAGMPVACGHGWLAGLTRIGEVSNSGAACAIQGCIALTRTSCGLAR